MLLSLKTVQLFQHIKNYLGIERTQFFSSNYSMFFLKIFRPVCDFIVDFYSRHLMGLPTLTVCLIVAKLPGQSVDFTQTVDLSGTLRSLMDLKRPQAVPELDLMHFFIQVEAWVLSLRRLSQSLSFERQLETVSICQRVIILIAYILQNLSDFEKVSFT